MSHIRIQPKLVLLYRLDEQITPTTNKINWVSLLNAHFYFIFYFSLPSMYTYFDFPCFFFFKYTSQLNIVTHIHYSTLRTLYSRNDLNGELNLNDWDHRFWTEEISPKNWWWIRMTTFCRDMCLNEVVCECLHFESLALFRFLFAHLCIVLNNSHTPYAHRKCVGPFYCCRRWRFVNFSFRIKFLFIVAVCVCVFFLYSVCRDTA